MSKVSLFVIMVQAFSLIVMAWMNLEQTDDNARQWKQCTELVTQSQEAIQGWKTAAAKWEETSGKWETLYKQVKP